MTAAEDFDSAYRSFRSWLRDQMNEERNSAWWRSYQLYLVSDEWKEIRAAVLSRAQGICEACGLRAARQVHHETYCRVGNENLADLLAVCIPCHLAKHEE